jgi:hypothetical protein
MRPNLDFLHITIFQTVNCESEMKLTNMGTSAILKELAPKQRLDIPRRGNETFSLAASEYFIRNENFR